MIRNKHFSMLKNNYTILIYSFYACFSYFSPKNFPIDTHLASSTPSLWKLAIKVKS